MEQIANWQVGFLLLTVGIASAISIYAAATSPGKGAFLCDDCRFNNDSDCLKAERPTAVMCTAYRSDSEPTPVPLPVGSDSAIDSAKTAD